MRELAGKAPDNNFAPSLANGLAAATFLWNVAEFGQELIGREPVFFRGTK